MAADPIAIQDLLDTYERNNRLADNVAQVKRAMEDAGYEDLSSLQAQYRRDANDALVELAELVRPGSTTDA